MSWNVTAQGKAGALRSYYVDEFGKIKCAEPEQSIAMKLGEAVDIALASFPENFPVKVQAYGSQGQPDFHKMPNKFSHTISLQIESIYGWKE